MMAVRWRSAYAVERDADGSVDGLEAWAQVVERGYEGFVAKTSRVPTRADGRDAGSR
jgi:hypothetical protein